MQPYARIPGFTEKIRLDHPAREALERYLRKVAREKGIEAAMELELSGHKSQRYI